MAAVDPFALFDEPAGSSFFAVLLTRSGDVRGGAVLSGLPCPGLSRGRFMHFRIDTAEMLFDDASDGDHLTHDCVRSELRECAGPSRVAGKDDHVRR